MPHSFAQALPTPVLADEPAREVLLAAASGPLEAALGQRVVLDVERVDRIGGWAFVLGTMRAPGGGRPELAGTRFQDAAARGAMSDVYVALLRHEPDAGGDVAGSDAGSRDAAGVGDPGVPAGGRWRVVDHAIGPGDVAWLGWPVEHAAPRALFGF